MRSLPSRPIRPRVRTPALLAGLAAAALTLACGGDAERRQAEARAVLEEEFGRRGGPEAPDEAGELDDGGEASPEAPGAEPGELEAAPRTEPSGGEADAASTGSAGGEPGETPPAPARPEGRDAGQAVDVDALLGTADRAYAGLPSLRATFEERVEVPLLERVREGRGVWYQEGRNRFRMDYRDPPDDVLVADGRYLWVYQPSAQPDQVIRSTLASGTPEVGTADLLGRILAEARTAYDAGYEGTETVSGVETHVVSLTPRGPSDWREVTVWIAPSDHLVRRFRLEREDETTRTVTLSELEPGLPLADSLFRFEVPEGVQVFEG